MKSKLTPRFYLALTIFSLMGQIAWVVENMYFNVFIYKMFNASAADIGAMVGASAVAATLTTVFMGALSDRVGKRKLFICGGYILWGISIFSFIFLKTETIGTFIPATMSAASVGVSLTIILDCVMTFFGSTANDAAFNAWLTDSTDSTNRGRAEGINAMMPLVAILAVFGGFMAFNLDDSQSWTLIFAIIGGATLLVGILGFFIISDPIIEPSKNGYWSNIIYGFKPKTIKQNSGLYKSLIVFILFNTSIQIFMPYLIIYYEVSLGMKDYVLIMAPAIIIASVVTAFWGRFYDKKGFKTSAVISLIWLILGYIVLGFFKSTALVFIGSLLMMCGYLSGMAVFGAVIRDNTPKGKAGRLQGIRIFSQVLIPGIVGPYIGSLVLSNAKTITNNDGTSSFIPNEGIFFAALFVAVIVFLLTIFVFGKKPPRTVKLETPFEKDLTETPFAQHPRPQMERKDYLSLNGKWKLTIKNGKKEKFSGDILVPFPPESKISGVESEYDPKDILIYERSFTLPENFNKDCVKLNFDAVDQICTVFLNGKLLGKNIGGYLPFSFDITDLIKQGENLVRVSVLDDLDTAIPYGKQRIKRGGMWYTPISGIWQSVWLEGMPKKHIEKMKLTPSLNSLIIETVGGEEEKAITVFYEQESKTYHYKGDRFELTIENPILWSPENPYLYHFKITSGADEINSYFALRTIEKINKNGSALMALNGKPYFFNGILDQGYFSDGIYMPSTPKGFEDDILSVKKLGFNMIRKHIKVEPDIFYYYCDLYGIAVFQDMVNSGKYNFLIDTALPTIGLKRGIKHKACKKQKNLFEKLGAKTTEHLYNHPSVLQYTIFNEGWGQYDGDIIYNKFKDMDPTRLYDTASGWFKPKKSDFNSEHVYFKPIKLKGDGENILFLSEFGGYSFKIDDHSFNLDKTYGYKKFNDRDSFVKALQTLYSDEVLPAVNEGLSATVLTQLSDVEDETNGLLTYDRKVTKVKQEEILPIFTAITDTFNNAFNG